MGLSCGAQCAKFILFAFNIVFWLSGVALIAAGIYVVVSDDLSILDDFLESGDNQLKYVAYGLIGIGAFVFVVGFCGCCGAIKENKCLLGMYIALLVIVLVVELAIGIYAATMRNKLKDTVVKAARDNLEKNYPGANSTSKQGANYKKTMDKFQMRGKCCGIKGPSDWLNTKWKKEAAPSFPKNYNVPPSCCMDKISGYKDEKYKSCITEKKYYTRGCTEFIEETIKANAPIVIGVGCGIAALEIFGLIFAICLCRSIRHTEYDA